MIHYKLCQICRIIFRGKKTHKNTLCNPRIMLKNKSGFIYHILFFFSYQAYLNKYMQYSSNSIISLINYLIWDIDTLLPSREYPDSQAFRLKLEPPPFTLRLPKSTTCFPGSPAQNGDHKTSQPP